MRDVAAKAGVTPTVVSRVLHNKATSIRVSEATAQRVRDAAKELEYRVNVFARNFRERQTNTIGVLHGVGFDRPILGRGSRYFGALMDGIIEGAFRHGYAVTLCPRLMSDTPEDAMSDGRFDGLIWYSTVPSDENVAMIRACSAPLVLIHPQPDDLVGCFPIVSCDNAGGVALALEHLTGLGHRRIAFARQGDQEFSESNLRRDAFESWMRTHGLLIDDADMLVVDPEDGVEAYLAAPPRHTAILAHNDELAAAFVRRAPAFGRRIPEDLSVVGFDSTSFCEEVRPTLTSVSQPLEAIGTRASELLVARIVGEALPTPGEMLSCGLDLRETTAKAAQTLSVR